MEKLKEQYNKFATLDFSKAKTKTAIYEDTSYFLGIVLDENEEPTEESAVLKEIIEEDGTYVEKCEDQTILTEVLKDFTKSLNKFVGTLPEE